MTREARHLDIETGRTERLSKRTHRGRITREAVEDQHASRRARRVRERLSTNEHLRMRRRVGHRPFLADQQPKGPPPRRLVSHRAERSGIGSSGYNAE